jgi:hypothetical protein
MKEFEGTYAETTGEEYFSIETIKEALEVLSNYISPPVAIAITFRADFYDRLMAQLPKKEYEHPVFGIPTHYGYTCYRLNNQKEDYKLVYTEEELQKLLAEDSNEQT